MRVNEVAPVFPQERLLPVMLGGNHALVVAREVPGINLVREIHLVGNAVHVLQFRGILQALLRFQLIHVYERFFNREIETVVITRARAEPHVKRVDALHVELAFLAPFLHEDRPGIVPSHGEVRFILVSPADFQDSQPAGGSEFQGIP